MADQWETIFKQLAEQTHAITEIIQNSNEGDDVSESIKEIRKHRDEVVKTGESAPSDVPDVYDEGIQQDLSNAADIPIIASNKLLTAFEEKSDFWKSEKDLGDIIKEVVKVNNEVLQKPYPATNPNAPEITGKTKKTEQESNRLAKAFKKAD